MWTQLILLAFDFSSAKGGRGTGTGEAKCMGHCSPGPVSIKAPPLQQAVYVEVLNTILIFLRVNAFKPIVTK